METMITALISGLCVAVPSLVATFFNNASNRKLTIYRLDELEKKVDRKHEDINKRLDENLYEISEIFNETSKRLNRTNKVAIL